MTDLMPCDWPVTVCDDCCAEQIEALDPATWQLFQDMAAFFLWRASGGVYGLCEKTYRPCRRNCDGSYGFGIGTPFIPWRINGNWVNIGCNRCAGECGCGMLSEIRLPSVHSVVRVRIDGVDLEPSGTVAVYNRSRIVRIDGEQWPACQNLAQLDGVGVWSITVEQGFPVPPGGNLMAGVLACEFAKACLNDDSCRLPRQIQQVTRQGVSIGFQDTFEKLPQMLTGIFEVDAFIEASRAYNRYSSPSIGSVDRPPPARLTWPIQEPVL